jgi:hypothetical protein
MLTPLSYLFCINLLLNEKRVKFYFTPVFRRAKIAYSFKIKK